ncbi:MAG: zinc dependent phospholipase C family protein [Clostridia bacterium]|nr:zinc dependent phospholipase C family protein [Clostridia bacterium]
MPALITHYLQSCDVYDKLSDLSLNKDAFCLGAYGPDFLYYRKLLLLDKKYRQIGVRLHALKADDIFTAFAEYISQHPDDNIALSYAMGFICHYCLDSTAHPFVYSLQNKIVDEKDIRYNPFFIHSKIEYILDVIMLREKRGMMTSQLSPKQCVTKDKDVLVGCADVMQYLIGKLDEEKTTSNELIKAYKEFRRYEGMTHDPLGVKHTLTRIAETLLLQPKSASTFIRPLMEDGEYDYSNFQKEQWENPFDENASEVDYSFFELSEKATEKSEALIRQFKAEIDKGNTKIDFMGNLSFKTGLVM